jgi:flagellar FliL protein
MVKPAPERRKPQVKRAEASADAIVAKARSERMLLGAALIMSVVSLGGGVLLARMAYIQDMGNFGLDYIDPETVQPERVDVGLGLGLGTNLGSDNLVSRAASDDASSLAASASEGAAAGHDAESGNESASGVSATASLLDFGELLTDIHGYNAHGAPTQAFLKMGIVLVYRPEPGATELLKEREPFIRDLFTTYLRGMNETDLRGMAGVMRVKSELLKRARAAVGNDLPQEILISDLIVN